MIAGKQWMSVSDLMAGLMMIFMFIAIVFMLQTEQEKEKIRELALTYQEYQQDLYEELLREFERDLDSWGAELLPDNTIRFNEPDVLFASSSSEINERFVEILDDFFPRYVSILYSDQFRDNIDEIRIEGHTSSVWGSVPEAERSPLEQSYLGNAALSQERSLSVLNYVFQLDTVNQYQEWMIDYLRANGLSYSRQIFDDNGDEDRIRSRRVEFRVLTRSEERIYTILESLENA